MPLGRKEDSPTGDNIYLIRVHRGWKNDESEGVEADQREVRI
jgi:hypothetical protein